MEEGNEGATLLDWWWFRVSVNKNNKQTGFKIYEQPARKVAEVSKGGEDGVEEKKGREWRVTCDRKRCGRWVG